MRLQDDLDFTTLSWVKGELDETLKQARHALEAYVEDPTDISQMRFCATYLHQVQGTLRMVELYGAAMVSEEMEALASALLGDGIRDRDDAYSVLMRGIVQLPDYLERLQTGHKDIPVVLLPLLNDLRAARGQKGLTESALFAPDLNRALPTSVVGPQQPLAAVEMKRQAEQLRMQFQLSLLKWLKNEDPATHVTRLAQVCDKLVEITAQEDARRLFWIAGGLLGALRENAFAAEPPLKQAIGRIEREIKRLVDPGEGSFRLDPPRELTRQLLYFAAHAPTQHGRIAEVRHAFDLASLVPTEEEIRHAQGSISGHNRALLDTVSAGIKEDLLRVKDALDLFMRTQSGDVASLSAQAEVLNRVADTLGMLGLGVPRGVVLEQKAAVQDVAGGKRVADESILLDIAGALLYVESSLDDQVQHLGAGGGQRDMANAESRRVLDALVKEAQSNFAQAKQCFVAFVESNWDHAQLQDVPRLLEEVAGALRILELDEPPRYLAAVSRFTEAELLTRHRVPNGQQLDTLADALASLEYFLEALREHRAGREKILDVARQRLEALGYWPIPEGAIEDVIEALPVAAAGVDVSRGAPPLEALAEMAPEPTAKPLPAPMPELRIEPAPVAQPEPVAESAAESTAVPEPLIEAAAEPPAPEPELPAPTLPTAALPLAAAEEVVDAEADIGVGFEGAGEEIDEEIREVFIEEVQEEISNLDELLPNWLNATGSAEALKPIRRVFHTLKGSGRLVGALTLGEFSWKIENMLNRVLDQTIAPDAGVQALLQEARQTLPQLLLALKGEGRITANLEGLKAVADRLAGGEKVTAAEVHHAGQPKRPSAPAVDAAAQRAREEAERALAERIEAERREAERLEAERLEAERREAERIEAERREAERREAERIEAERREAERLEAERREAERIEAERREAERLEAERQAELRREAARLEAERIEAELAAANLVGDDEEWVGEDEAEVGGGLLDDLRATGTPFSIDAVLFDILKSEVAGHLETVDKYIDSAVPHPVTVPDSLLRSVHTMSGAFAMTEVPHITEVVGPLEGYIKRLIAHHRIPEMRGVDLMGEAAAAIRLLMQALETDPPFAPDFGDLSQRLMALRDSLPEPTGPLLPMHDDEEVEAASAAPVEAELETEARPVDTLATELEALLPLDGEAEELPSDTVIEEIASATVAPAAELEAEATEVLEPELEAAAEGVEVEELSFEDLELAAELTEPAAGSERDEFEIVETEFADLEPNEVITAADEPSAETVVAAAAVDAHHDPEAESLVALLLAEAPTEAETTLDSDAAATAEKTVADERREAERLEAERLEAERLESERLESERLEAERREAERLEAERLEAERREAERLEAERLEAERREAERREAERREAERLEAERLEAERLEAERLEAERREAERLEAERLEAERREAERLEAERAEAERAEAERLEAQRLEAERLEAERAEAERLEAERAEAERLEAERLEAERAEAERLEAERAEAERLEAERAEAERAEAERAEAERAEAERAEAERAEAERAEAERAEAERLEATLRATTPVAVEPVAVKQAKAGSGIAALAAADPDPDGPLELPDLDEELLDIFLEEGVDILDHSDGLLNKLREAPGDREVVVGLQRDLHTLKGGARMAGLAPIGDLGHAAESLLEAVADGRRDLGSAGMEVLERVFDRLHGMVTRVGERRALAMPNTLLGLVEALVRGEPLPLPAAEAEPEVEAEAAADAAPAAVVPAPAAVAAAPAASAAKPAPAPSPAPASRPTALDSVDEEESGVRAPQEQIRIRADLLDRLVNYAGEVAIYRARLEQQIGAFRGGLAEMDATTSRLREQLRRLEIETEAQIIARYQREQDDAEAQNFDPLELDRFSTLQQLSRALNESAADLTNLQGTLDDLTRQYETLLLQQSRVSSELQEGLMRTRMVPFDALVPRLRRILRQTASELGKKAQLKVEGAQGEMDRNVLDRMTAPLEHMLRNALAHGLELPSDRAAVGKPEEGTVRIHVSREASEVVIRVSDDGRGMDRDAIRRKAIERGLMLPDAQLSDRDIYGFVLEAGFSTAQSVSKIAGRGVGMDVVASEVKQLGGSLHIESVFGKGSEFVIRLPFTLAVTQAVFVKLAETVFAVPIASVQGVARIAPADLAAQLASPEPHFEYAGERYAIHDLGLLLGHPSVKAAESLQVPLLLARSGDLRSAICVDSVIGSKEIVVKQTGPQVSSIPGIFGATVMGDGSVVVILDVTPLVRRAAALRLAGEAVHAAELPEQRKVPLVMVVDDSITMRKVSSRVLERAGYEVATAKDGVDAIEKMVERVPDAMLLDIEMPRMDGYELATHMRNDVRLRGVPIIMITSRTGEKHRQRAFEIGVDRYLGKPYQEPELLRNVADVLGHAPVE